MSDMEIITEISKPTQTYKTSETRNRRYETRGKVTEDFFELYGDEAKYDVSDRAREIARPPQAVDVAFFEDVA